LGYPVLGWVIWINSIEHTVGSEMCIKTIL
jgi:hypothetical protein